MKPAMIAAAAAVMVSMGVASAASSDSNSSHDHARNQQWAQATPGYSIGTGVAHVGDGSDPGYYAPGYSGGTGAARIGDGSDPGYLATQRYLQNSPGRGGADG
ncbi:MAG TPA: hypothetical protein VMB34_33115 [Acetobacteraceae bacterium]|nr:hypothetical protein [Acetobacteraceae bacterium]